MSTAIESVNTVAAAANQWITLNEERLIALSKLPGDKNHLQKVVAELTPLKAYAVQLNRLGRTYSNEQLALDKDFDLSTSLLRATLTRINTVYDTIFQTTIQLQREKFAKR